MAPRRPVRKGRLFLVLALLLLLGGGGRYGYWTVIEHRFQTITPDRVYQSGELSPSMLAKKLDAHGIRTVIDLRGEDPEGRNTEEDSLAERGVRYVHLPSRQVPSDEVVDTFLEVMETAETPVLIHCQDGYGRSVMLSALYRIEFEGWEVEKAWRATNLLPWFGNFAPDSKKGSYLLAYEPRRARAAPGDEAPPPAPAPSAPAASDDEAEADAPADSR